MRKIISIAALLWLACAAWAGVEVNTATVVELDGTKGIGPSLSARILDARQHGDFKDWQDLMARVKGIRRAKAAELSAAGLTVHGVAFPPVAPASATKD